MSAGFPVDASERRKMAKREGSSASGPRTRSKAAEEGREAREAENAQRLDKLPQELWEKILDHLEENDLFPLALSCRCFRQKQKELVAQAMENVPESGKPRLALKTTLRREPEKNPPVSAEYLRFCWNEKVMKNSLNIMCLAAYHGYMPLLQEPLLQEFLAGTEWPNPEITEAGESSSSQSRRSSLFWLLTLSLLHSVHRPETGQYKAAFVGEWGLSCCL